MTIQLLTRILLGEDDPDIQEIAALTLETLGGFTVEACNTGIEALEAVPRFLPDLILLDVLMPELDGLGVLTELRANPEFMDIPIIFMTAKVMEEEIDQLREMGAMDVIHKPFDPQFLADQVKEIWANHHG